MNSDHYGYMSGMKRREIVSWKEGMRSLSCYPFQAVSEGNIDLKNCLSFSGSGLEGNIMHIICRKPK